MAQIQFSAITRLSERLEERCVRVTANAQGLTATVLIEGFVR
jgi:hypothetical protein